MPSALLLLLLTSPLIYFPVHVRRSKHMHTMVPLRVICLASLGSSLASTLPADQAVLMPFAEARPGSDVGKVQRRLREAEIFPTVIDEFSPSFLLEAQWSADAHASLGNTLKVRKLQNQPGFSLTPATGSSASSLCDHGMSYTVALTDPDAPSRDNPKWSEVCHFIGTGLAVASSVDEKGVCSAARLADLEDIMPYKPPGPPPKTGKHRYVFLVFAPANGTTDPLHLSKPEDRKHWGSDQEGYGVREWAHENGLKPVAANFIYAQNKEQ